MKKFQYILGIQCFATIDSGACIIRVNTDSQEYSYVAISEERLLRKKHPYTFPLLSIKYCMDHFNLKSLDQIDLLVSDIIREPVWNRSGPSYNVKDFDYIKSILNFPKKKIIQIGHHLAHAASVYYTSGFKNSAILIVDGNGTDLETNSFYEGKNDKIKLIDKYKARGIGIVYNSITKDCLNLGTGGEGKTMGLAPFGKHSGKRILDFSKVKFNGVETDYSSIIRRMPFSDILTFQGKSKIKKLNLKLKKRKNSENILTGNWKKIAYEIQDHTEKCFIHLGKEIKKRVKSKNICIAGGVALNSVANQKLFDNTNFKDIYVYPACSDAGAPFGLAIWALYNHPKFKIKKRKVLKMKNAYTGITYSDNSIISTLDKYKVKFEKMNLKKIAKHISEGKIIGWFQNGSEYGPRALGNRSILADSRNPKMQDIVNDRVKHRENYRPFAPAVLEEDYKKFFELNRPSPYMLLVAKVKKPKLIPSVTHVDGTARVQTVNKNQNKIFYSLIKEFKKITGIGCILNTSFNDAGEPIVETAEDALLGLLNSDIDYLVLGNQVVDSKHINKSLKKRILSDRSKKIKINLNISTKLLTKNYNNKDKKRYFKKEEKNANWFTVKKPLFDLNNRINLWLKENKKIILYGTYDQTNFLLKKIKKLKKLNLVSFLPYKYINDDIKNKKKLDISLKKIKVLPKVLSKDTEILITSYEFCYDIEREIKKKNELNFFKFYNGYSRDLMSNL
jgi:carbamoyltransferase